MIRTPAFWWNAHPTPLARLLQPLGGLYGSLTAKRMARAGLRLPVPVVCIGNLTAGGAGKTPTALAIARLLLAHGYRPAFLSRGYGRDRARADAVIRVDPTRHDARQCGDEPLLLAGVAPTYVAADRRASAAAALADGATILILDDGLQNPALHKDLAIAVIDGAVGFGNGLCFPAGPLRAPAARQWPHVGLVCVIGAEAEPRTFGAPVPVLSAQLVPDEASLTRLSGQRLYAFAGIGRPEKFFDTLARHGLEVAGRRSFPDHHRFSAADRDDLVGAADAYGARLVTTAKDRARLPREFPVEVLGVELRFEDENQLATLLGQTLEPASTL